MSYKREKADFIALIDKYFEKCLAEKMPPTVAGLTDHLNVPRARLDSWRRVGHPHKPGLDAAFRKILRAYEEALLKGGKNVQGVLVLMKRDFPDDFASRAASASVKITDYNKKNDAVPENK